MVLLVNVLLILPLLRLPYVLHLQDFLSVHVVQVHFLVFDYLILTCFKVNIFILQLKIFLPVLFGQLLIVVLLLNHEVFPFLFLALGIWHLIHSLFHQLRLIFLLEMFILVRFLLNMIYFLQLTECIFIGLIVGHGVL